MCTRISTYTYSCSTGTAAIIAYRPSRIATLPHGAHKFESPCGHPHVAGLRMRTEAPCPRHGRCGNLDDNEDGQKFFYKTYHVQSTSASTGQSGTSAYYHDVSTMLYRVTSTLHSSLWWTHCHALQLVTSGQTRHAL